MRTTLLALLLALATARPAGAQSTGASLEVAVDPVGRYAVLSHAPEWSFAGDVGHPLSNIRAADGQDGQIFDPQGGFIGAFGTPGDAATAFRLPSALAVSLTRGDIYVADTDENRIVRYSPTSPDPVPMGQTGSAPDQFLAPGGVAIDRQGNVFVADTGNRRILRLAAPTRP